MFAWKIPVVVLLMSTCLQAYADGPARFNFKGRVVDKNPCTINNGKQILIPFDNITQEKSDGKQIQKKIDLNVVCTEEYVNSALRMQILGTASFADNVLKTDMDDLGIVFYKNGAPVELQTWFNLPKPASSLLLTASPIANGKSKMPGGNFTASATLLVNIQ
ncbi:fimbrial protein [Erwinia sp. JUb26]|uniref:fimbrial protein n=1 Tax=Erwinia sp. JUb26 TaxID=2485126 RepID=UPI000F46C815|nr:fimbrial protein [Erwinia sp. JUb26]ROR08672.1 fimbrial protein [Erwinia sp. JUb26]